MIKSLIASTYVSIAMLTMPMGIAVASYNYSINKFDVDIRCRDGQPVAAVAAVGENIPVAVYETDSGASVSDWISDPNHKTTAVKLTDGKSYIATAGITGGDYQQVNFKASCLTNTTIDIRHKFNLRGEFVVFRHSSSADFDRVYVSFKGDYGTKSTEIHNIDNFAKTEVPDNTTTISIKAVTPDGLGFLSRSINL